MIFCRYYGLCEKLDTLHADPSKAGSKPFHYDGDHERRRKEQLKRLYNRTQEEIEEEEMLRAELKKIEARKKEREKKTQDLQKLIAQADSTSKNPILDKKALKKKMLSNGGSDINKINALKEPMDTGGIKFPDFNVNSGVSLRSQRMKLPPSVGQKKTKAIEQMLAEAGVDKNPVPSDAMCTEFNDLRSDMVLLYELKAALQTCEQELHSLKAQYETLCPGKTLEIPEKLRPHQPSALKGDKPKNISDVIDVVGTGPTPPIRKRKAALEQSNVMKKIKNKV